MSDSSTPVQVAQACRNSWHTRRNTKLLRQKGQRYLQKHMADNPTSVIFHYLYAVQVDLAMEHTNNIDKALSSFKILAATQAAATENGDYKKGNKAFKQIIQIIKYLKGLERVNELEALLSDSNVGVRMFAAFGLLQTYPDVAVHILKEIAQRDDIHSLTANETLKQWESKALIYPF